MTRGLPGPQRPRKLLIVNHEPHSDGPGEGGDEVDGRVRRARELRQARRQQLLDAARRVFARRGYQETSLQDLLEEAGVARGTFYQHFSGKQGVFEALVGDFLDALGAALVRIDVASPTPPTVQLMANIDRILTLVYGNADLTRIFLHEAAGLDRELDDKLAEFDDRVLDMMTRSLKTGVDLGIVRPGPLHLRAVFVLGAFKEAIRKELLGEGHEPLPRAELARHIMDFFLRGLLV